MNIISIPVLDIFTPTYLFPNYSGRCHAASVRLGGEVGVVPLTPSRTPIYAMIYAILSRYAGADPDTSSATPGGVTVRVIPPCWFQPK